MAATDGGDATVRMRSVASGLAASDAGERAAAGYKHIDSLLTPRSVSGPSFGESFV